MIISGFRINKPKGAMWARRIIKFDVGSFVSGFIVCGTHPCWVAVKSVREYAAAIKPMIIRVGISE